MKLNYDLLKIDKDSILDELKTHLKQYLKSDKKILIEFIKKKTAHDFGQIYKKMKILKMCK